MEHALSFNENENLLLKGYFSKINIIEKLSKEENKKLCFICTSERNKQYNIMRIENEKKMIKTYL